MGGRSWVRGPLGGFHLRHGGLGFHPLRDFRWRGWPNCCLWWQKWQGKRIREAVISTMRLIVSVGWSIYPLGYFFGYLMGGVQDSVLNLVYNLADFVNKIAFCLAIWASAKQSTLEKAAEARQPLLPAE